MEFMTAKEMASVKALQEAAIVKGDLRTAAEYAARIAFAESSEEEREECSLATVKATTIVARFEDSEDKEDLESFFSREWSRLVCENLYLVLCQAIAQRLASMSDVRLQIVIAILTAQGLNSQADKDLHTALCAEVLKRKKG